MYNQDDIKASVQSVLSILTTELAIVDGQAENIYLGGFSKGGCIALAAFL
jgi:predicted esterase